MASAPPGRVLDGSAVSGRTPAMGDQRRPPSGQTLMAEPRRTECPIDVAGGSVCARRGWLVLGALTAVCRCRVLWRATGMKATIRRKLLVGFLAVAGLVVGVGGISLAA